MEPRATAFNGIAGSVGEPKPKPADTTEREGKRRPAPFSLRLTFEQRARLESEADGMSINAYIHLRLFGTDKPARRRNHAPIRDHQALAAVLGGLGQSRLANNLNQLAKLANQGTLLVTPDTEAALTAAAADIEEMRDQLLKALGRVIIP